MGIPMIGCDCAVCRSDDPRDKRNRCCALLKLNGKQILIDTPPELRLACIANHVRWIDTCLITHTHADHLFGLDDLRRFNQIQRSTIDLWASPFHMEKIDRTFRYARHTERPESVDLPQLIFREIQPDTQEADLYGNSLRAFSLPHGHHISMGFRINDFAYCTDMHEMPPSVIDALAGVKTIVLGALRDEPHPAHLTINQALEIVGQLGVEQTWLVHMSHHISHARDSKRLPPGVQFAWDGLEIDI